MSEHDDWQASQHHDECLRQQRVDEILTAAERRPLEVEEILIIAGEIGVQYLPRNNPTR